MWGSLEDGWTEDRDREGEEVESAGCALLWAFWVWVSVVLVCWLDLHVFSEDMLIDVGAQRNVW
jgi:hypothetical protein